MEHMGDYDTRGRDLDQRYARFGTVALTDEEICALSMASLVMPEGSPGAAAFLCQVAEARGYVPELVRWGRMVAEGIASGRHLSKHGKRRRTYVEGYTSAWGRFAVADALSLVLLGNAPPIASRCESLGIGKQGYQRIRDFVAGALICALTEYRCALEWAWGWRRDRVFEGRWEGITGLKWDGRPRDAIVGQPRGLARGCYRTVPVSDQADAYATPPETLYPGLRASTWWREQNQPRHGTHSPAADERAAHAVAAAQARGAPK